MQLYEEIKKVTQHYSIVELLTRAPLDGLILEFGVSAGESLRTLGTSTTNTVYGFDWWKGLPETMYGIREGQQCTHDAEGSWSGAPEPGYLPANCILVDGLIADSLPKFLLEHTEQVAFVHIDVDLYSSTKTVLTELKDRLMDNAILAFDEFVDYSPGIWEYHEYKAFKEFIEETGYSYECIAQAGPRVAFRIYRSI